MRHSFSLQKDKHVFFKRQMNTLDLQKRPFILGSNDLVSIFRISEYVIECCTYLFGKFTRFNMPFCDQHCGIKNLQGVLHPREPWLLFLLGQSCIPGNISLHIVDLNKKCIVYRKCAPNNGDESNVADQTNVADQANVADVPCYRGCVWERAVETTSTQVSDKSQ